MSEEKIAVHRVDYNYGDWFWKELQCGRLHQGWGVPGTQLQEDGNDLPVEIWRPRYIEASKQYWDEDTTKKQADNRYLILHRMIELELGDLVIVPKLPESDQFVLTRALGRYEFDMAASGERGDNDDHRHTILVEPSETKVIGYSSCPQAETVRSKLNAYRSAVNLVGNSEFQHAVRFLAGSPPSTATKSPVELFSEARSLLVGNLLRQLNHEFGHDKIEALVRRVFEATGYEFLESNRYDGRGGDADLIFRRNLPLLGDEADVDLKVYVQVKQKAGVDSDDVEGVKQLVLITENEPGAIRVLVSTADMFSERCKKLAAEEGVALIGGTRVADMILTYVRNA